MKPRRRERRPRLAELDPRAHRLIEHVARDRARQQCLVIEHQRRGSVERDGGESRAGTSSTSGEQIHQRIVFQRERGDRRVASRRLQQVDEAARADAADSSASAGQPSPAAGPSASKRCYGGGGRPLARPPGRRGGGSRNRRTAPRRRPRAAHRRVRGPGANVSLSTARRTVADSSSIVQWRS